MMHDINYIKKKQIEDLHCWWNLKYAYYIPYRGVKPLSPKKECPKYGTKLYPMFGSNSRALGNVEYSFITITPSLLQNDSIC